MFGRRGTTVLALVRAILNNAAVLVCGFWLIFGEFFMMRFSPLCRIESSISEFVLEELVNIENFGVLQFQNTF